MLFNELMFVAVFGLLIFTAYAMIWWADSRTVYSSDFLIGLADRIQWKPPYMRWSYVGPFDALLTYFSKPIHTMSLTELTSDAVCKPIREEPIVNYFNEPDEFPQTFWYPSKESHVIDAPLVECSRKTELFIGIKSAYHNSNRRNRVRKAWLSSKADCDTDSKAESRLCRWASRRTSYAFFVSRPENLTMEEAEEGVEHGDVNLISLVEHYRNLTLKTTTIFHWAVSRCPTARYVLVIDDDAYVNLKNTWRLIVTGEVRRSEGKPPVGQFSDLLSFEKTYNFLRSDRSPMYNEKLFTGHVQKLPETSRTTMWRVPKQVFLPMYYPDYIPGWFTLMSATVAELIVRVALCSVEFWVDDVFLNGMIPQYLGIPRLQAPGLNRSEYLTPELMDNSVAVLLDKVNSDFYNPNLLPASQLDSSKS